LSALTRWADIGRFLLLPGADDNNSGVSCLPVSPRPPDSPLRRSDLDVDPVEQFRRWFALARQSNPMPEAMALCTAGRDGRPAGRMVLLKGISEEGFDFYTSYESNKAKDLDQNPRAALVFWWIELDRQVRVEGSVTRLDRATSDEYFATRPRGAQLSAIASHQSSGVADRRALEDAVEEVAVAHPQGALVRPGQWGGYRVRPEAIEFWQGRHDRLHDRFLYARLPDGGWEIERLQP
jgi:pyridoxamine 5'-phosphate oxidase